MEISRFAFLRPPLGDLGATYHDHLRLIGKHIVDFLLALIELFLARCYGWGTTSDYQFNISDFASTGVGWPKISGRRGRPPPTIFILRKLG